MTRRQFLALIVPLLAILMGYVVLVAVERSGAPGAPPHDEEFARYVRSTMAREFVWGIKDERAAWEAYFRGLNEEIRSYDPYAEVVPPWEVEASREQSSGQYPGIGVRIQHPTTTGPLESVQIIGVKPGGPAAKAGLQVGDSIIGVGGRPVAEICPEGDDRPLQEVIRGPEGTKVSLDLRGPDGAEREVEVARARIDTGSVFGVRMADQARGFGYARIGAFQSSTPQDLREAVDSLLEQGMRGFVLDLRHNPGGLLESAIRVADLFLNGGIIVRQRGRLGAYTETHRAKEDGTLSATLPLVVLIDGGSASASEILAGALRDHRRAVLVGTRSWGKFLVQVVEAVEMEAGTALFKRTTSVYETPLGYHYQRRPDANGDDPLAGLQPDVYVPLSRAETRDLQRVFRDEFYADWNPEGKPPPPDGFVDPQLAAAVAVLAGETYYPRLLDADE